MHNTLQSLTKIIPDSHTAFLFPSGDSCTHGYLRNLKEKCSKDLELLKDKKAVIYGRSRKEFALLLYLLDGVASEILFLPNDINEELFQRYINQVDIDYQVEYDRDKGISILPIKSIDKLSEIDNKIQTKWIIPTSGTTNIPKLVAHNLDSLMRTIKLNIEVGKNFTWGLVYDIYRFAGIQVYLQALLGGSSLAIPDTDMSMNDLLSFFAQCDCNTISATPSFWRKALMSSHINDLNLLNVTLGGEISDDLILKSLKKKFPDAKIRHIYASTEAGVGFSVDDCKAGFPLSYINSKESGVELKIDESGQLCINPDKKSQQYVSGSPMYEDDGFIKTGDLVDIVGDRVIFLGRDSGAINVGGNKVQPEEVEHCILETGLVSEVVVYGKSSSMLGSLVCANVVLKDIEHDQKVAKQKIISHCRSKLEPYKVPGILKLVKEIEITQSGKIKRG